MSAVSIQPEWCLDLSLQQQSVLLLAARGPDGISKDHPCKDIQRHYRACVLVGARIGRVYEWGEKGDTFMSLDLFPDQWVETVKRFLHVIDALPHHFLMHLMHGAEILAYKHPDVRFRERWWHLYAEMVSDAHLSIETEAEMDERLNDFGREGW